MEHSHQDMNVREAALTLKLKSSSSTRLADWLNNAAADERYLGLITGISISEKCGGRYGGKDINVIIKYCYIYLKVIFILLFALLYQFGCQHIESLHQDIGIGVTGGSSRSR